MITDPTNVPTGDRRPLLVLLPPPQPTTVPNVLLAAARLLQMNGFWQHDYLPDPFDRTLKTPHASRPMSMVAAIRCAATGDPHRTSQLADTAIGFVALSIDGGPYDPNLLSLERHVDAWGDEPGRTVDEAVALLEQLATAPERAA
ncbi:hypothetical protein ACFY7C_12185 [Streptomyces sp. NPDC012769]|uniref:DUF6197 family protein n=1 Tax=Streptomyces sp. NPDC012769 TaxID=3364848 RepID=UPI0036884BD2